MAIFDLAGKASGQPAVAAARRSRAPSRSRCNATLAAGEPARSPPTPSAGPRAGFDTFKLKLGAGDDVAQVRGGARGGRPERAGSASTPTAPGRVDEAIGVLSDDRAARHRAGRAAGGDAARAGRGQRRDRRSRSPPTRASRPRKEAQRPPRAGACELATVKLAKVGGIGEANGIAGRAADLPLERARRPGRDRGRGARRPGATASTGTAAGLAHGLATQLLFAETIAARECELDGDAAQLPTARGSGSRSTRTRWRDRLQRSD